MKAFTGSTTSTIKSGGHVNCDYKTQIQYTTSIFRVARSPGKPGKTWKTAKMQNLTLKNLEKRLNLAVFQVFSGFDPKLDLAP